jgi:DNA replication protein DnaC
MAIPRHTQNSSDNDGSILSMIEHASQAERNTSVRHCQKCGDALEMDIVILGKLRRLPIICRCRELEIRLEEESRAARETERRLNKYHRYSLMNELFAASTFDNWRFRDDNRLLYDFALCYCEQWETMKRNNRGVLFCGAAGTGKSYAAYALRMSCASKGRQQWLYRCLKYSR